MSISSGKSRKTETLQVALGVRCRAARHAAELSQLEVTRRFDISLSHLQKIERGVLDPRLTTLAKFAEAYGVTVSQLLEGVGPVPGKKNDAKAAPSRAPKRSRAAK